MLKELAPMMVFGCLVFTMIGLAHHYVIGWPWEKNFHQNNLDEED